MKIETKVVDQTIKDIDNGTYKCALLYGDNNSAVNTKYTAILNNFKEKKYEIVDISPERVRENEGFLIEEFVSISMFSSNSVYTLKLLEKENSFTKILENLLEKNNLTDNKNFLLITAGTLETTSSLRKYAEKSKQIACIACYEESIKNINIFINNKLKEFNFKYSTDVVNYLNEKIGNNSLNIENEIKKIDLYKGDDRNLAIDDVKNCVNDISQTKLNDFCNSFCSLDKEKTFKILNKIIQENVELIIIIRMLIKYFLQLQRIKYRVDNKENIDEIIGKKCENIFWAQQSFVKAHINSWSLNEINDILEKLIIIEKNVKFTNNITEFEDFIMKCFMVKNKLH